MKAILAAVLVATAGLPAQARTHVFHAWLTGAQQSAPVATPASGVGRFTYDDATHDLAWTIRYSGLSSQPTGAHLHAPGPRGEDTGVVVDIGVAGATGTSGTIAGSALANYTIGLYMMTGQAYFNLHSVDHGLGEIRGQITREAPWSDFDGSGGTDIFWSSPSLGRAIWTMDGTAVTGSALILGPGDWNAQAVGDFNGDGRSDVVWYDPMASRTAIWLMNGTAPDSGAIVFEGPWKPVAETPVDFDGDGKSDLYFTNLATGDSAIWLMDGLIPTQTDYAFRAATRLSAWRFGDFNGDGKTDIVTHNAQNGEYYVHFMDGLSPTGGGQLFYSFAGNELRGVGDLNGDGKDDILIYNASTGDVRVWLLDGVTVIGSSLIYVASGGWSPATLTRLVDFDGDGKADILFANADGSHAIWLMDGITPKATGILLGPGTWKASVVRDFNGDGRADILWVNAAAGGQVALWVMDGLAVLDSALLFGGGGGWSPQLAPMP